ncbi:MAG: gp265 [uncultured marine phage]|uniref:Gp265 n=1 Tax=uncultured marine phage TaxID=707152 RepID=A0A8D9C9T5_9VIRU|nr:MAG: gp265 [uncultured marine phage]
MKSFALLRTNVALTTNLQIVVSSDDKLYMESFDSNDYLSDDQYKKMQFGKDAVYDQLIPTFFGDLTPNYAYQVKFDEDKSQMYNDFIDQFDDIYQAGCANVRNTDYNEEFECFAPLHFEKEEFPENFIIFRVDGPGLVEMSKDNFKEEILDNLKCVSVFDLSGKTNIGQWIEKSFKNNITFPDDKFDFDVREGEFSSWSGIDYDSGGYTSKSLFMKDILEKETTFFEFDQLLTDGYQTQRVVYPNIVNLKFLFDDTPATKTTLRKWSINRYYGFYLDSLELTKCVTAYSPPILNGGFTILEDNIINSIGKDPFVKGFVEGKTYVEYFGQFYLVEKLDSGEFKIIAPFNLEGKQDYINKEIINIDDDNIITYNTKYNKTTFSIDCFEDADVWIIDINGKFHVVKEENGSYYINTDYGFSVNNNKFDYWINESDSSYRTSLDLDKIDKNNPPLTFPIYKLNFTEVKEFDTNIVNSDFARYEYEKSDEISSTHEPKIFVEDGNSDTNPKEFNEYIYGNELVRIPASSEYVGTSEIFEVRNFTDEFLNDLSDIWRKNPIFCKWGYEGSISNGDYPYRLNNNFYGEDLNRSTNVYEPLPNRVERNLDYFYTINPDSTDYIDHTLHVMQFDDNLNLDTDFNFEIDKYFNFGTVSSDCCEGPISGTYTNDYFDYLFSKKEYLDNGDIVRNTMKYSTFLKGDNSVANTSIFRGIKFKIYDVDKVITNTNQSGDVNINSISLIPNNKYEDWKLSILLSDFSFNIDDVNFATDPTSTESINNMSWEIIDVWKLESSYIPNDVVLHHDVIYKNISGTVSTIDDPSENPGNSDDWGVGTFSSAFWSPLDTYSVGDWVYNCCEYYERVFVGTAGNGDFFTPGLTYTPGDIVLYQNDYFESTSTNSTVPTVSSNWSEVSGTFSNFWDKIEQWKSNFSYSINNYVYYQGGLYISNNNANSNNQPDITSNWTLEYTLEPNTDTIYGTDLSGNNIIEMNNRFYLLLDNPNNDTLDNGINVYINKKWNNVLINIYINDNTMSDLKNVNRDVLYTDINQKLTAKNFIEALNDLDDSREFANYINYYVIETDGSYNKYNIDNITELPVMLVAEDPDEFSTLIGSMIRTPIILDQNIIKANFELNDNEINDISQLNYYNGNPIGIGLTKTTDDETERLTKQATMYRFNGNYSPIFREVELFKRPELCNKTTGNYIFDTELTNFGVMRERVMSKVNLIDNVFKLKNATSVKSIYPQLDEYGYTFDDHFIFKSTWDNKYYIKVSKP